MRKLKVYLNYNKEEKALVGTLAESDRGKTYFEYNQDFIQNGVNISPFKLELKTGLQLNNDRYPSGSFGVFDDSLPDSWGTLLMDRFFQKNNISLRNITAIDRLSYIGDNAMGALSYVPTQNYKIEKTKIIDLHKISQNSLEILQGKAETILPEIFRLGGSPGGARPKILVGYNGKDLIAGESKLPKGYENWLIKFRATNDFIDTGKIEQAYSEMARMANIEITDTKLFKDHLNNEYFGTKRFDRNSDNQRIHVHTLSNLIHSNYIELALDYETLIRVSSALTKNYNDVKKCFQLMVFNVAAHNRDDHGKNFAFVMDKSGKWSFAPAYDLTYSPGPGGEHSTTIAGEGKNITKSDILKIADIADIPRKEAVSIINEINESVSKWETIAKDLGINKNEIKEIKDSINNAKLYEQHFNIGKIEDPFKQRNNQDPGSRESVTKNNGIDL